MSETVGKSSAEQQSLRIENLRTYIENVPVGSIQFLALLDYYIHRRDKGFLELIESEQDKSPSSFFRTNTIESQSIIAKFVSRHKTNIDQRSADPSYKETFNYIGSCDPGVGPDTIQVQFSDLGSKLFQRLSSA